MLMAKGSLLNMNTQQQDYKQLLSAVIKKQIVILGPDITLVKARNVKGLVVADDGTVTDIAGDPQQLTQQLIDQFVQLSGEIVRKTMEPLLNVTQATPTPPSSPTPAVTPLPVPSQPIATASVPADAQQMPASPTISATPTPQQTSTPQTSSPVQTTLAQQTNSVQ